MCIIIAKPAGIKLDRELYEQCFLRNGDGGGISYSDGHQLIVDKGFFNFDSMYEAIKENEQREMLIHFRIQTHGTVSIDNCHPFYTASTLVPRYEFAIAHNGTLSWPASNGKSDTHCFVEAVLGPHLNRDPYFLEHAPGRYLLGSSIGTRNKIAVMRYDKDENKTETFIVNSAEGHKEHGCWFSNYSYVIYKPQTNWNNGSDYGQTFDYKEFEEEDPVTKIKRTVWKKVFKKPNGPHVHQTNLPGLAKADRPIFASGDYTLNYLSKKQKKRYRQLASDYCKTFFPELNGFSENNHIHWLREGVRDEVPSAREIASLKELDMWIIRQADDYSDSKIPPTLVASTVPAITYV